MRMRKRSIYKEYTVKGMCTFWIPAMDDAPMNQILEATEFRERDTHAPDARDADVRESARFPRERFLRCVTLSLVIAAIGWMAWRPAMLRLSQLVFLVSPSRGESLAWRPETDDIPMSLPAKKETAQPDEWRPGAAARDEWRAVRPESAEELSWGGAGILPIRWNRLSGNPWNWRDDSAAHMRREEMPQPPQKSATAFRVKEEDAWEKSTVDAETPKQEEAKTEETIARTEAAPERGDDPNLLELPPLPLENIRAIPTLEPVETTMAARPETQIQTQAPASAPESADWKNREITAPVPGAYLTIYPKLKFIGLCVPGQGYIRKYNQVGVPENPAGGKLAADDGLTPYGQYYVAARSTAGQGTKLELSWPSPEDAMRIGLGIPERAAIEAAWREQTLPPQDTTAGGGIALSDSREETTKGGFALEAQHMEEIATALPDGAWVFIQE